MEPVKKRARTKRPVASVQGSAKEAQKSDGVQPGARPDQSAGQPEGDNKGLAFLRLSSECRPSTHVSPLIYVSKEVLNIGRLPSNDVVMDSKRTPQMISRNHAKLVSKMGTQEWVIHDCKSLNGITVNGEHVGEEGRSLRAGDVINFGRRVQPPEFEFIFEAPASSAQPVDEALAQMKRIADLEKELKVQRDAEAEARKLRQASRDMLNVSELSGELACCVCKDWLVHAATIQCSHSFCWSCIDRWLQTQQFVCPVCRDEVTREPVRTRAVDTIVQKTVQRLPAAEQAEYEERVRAAEAEDSRSRKNLKELEKHIDDAVKSGKSFFHINQVWAKKDKDTFKKGVNQYTGNARETYCRLTGLTVQWVHSADSRQLNVALHNLGLGKQVDRPEDEIRQRLLMFLRYG